MNKITIHIQDRQWQIMHSKSSKFDSFEFLYNSETCEIKRIKWNGLFHQTKRKKQLITERNPEEWITEDPILKLCGKQLNSYWVQPMLTLQENKKYTIISSEK